MTNNLPAVIEARAEQAEAKASGDMVRANAAYQRELQALAQSGPAAPVSTSAVVPAAATSEDIEENLARLAQLDGPGAVAELRRSWGADLPNNLGYVFHVEERFNVRPWSNESEQLSSGVALAKQVFAILHPGATPSPLSPAEVERFLSYREDADVIRYRHGLAQDLGYAAWMIGEFDGGDLSRVGLLKMAASIGRAVVHHEAPAQSARTTTTAQEGNTVSGMDEVQWDKYIRGIRQEAAEAQARGNGRLANEHYRREQEAIAQRKGNAPVVGSHGRTA